jgi:hypothetical protein
MIVTPSDFQGKLSIGQLEHPDVAARVQLFIDEYEPLYLSNLLGDELSQSFEAGYVKELAGDFVLAGGYWRDAGVWIDDLEWPEQKWTHLADKIKRPCILYIYYKYREDNVTQYAGVGEVLNKSENAVNMPVDYKMIRAWNEMVKRNLDFRLWIDEKTYPEYSRKFYRNLHTEIFSMINRFGI